MKILMIGGNGFLGKHIQSLLSEHEVFAPPRALINWLTGHGVFVLEQYDVVIHLLAIYGGLPFCMNNRVKMAVENMEINARVFRYLADNPPKRLITMGSGCEYPGFVTGVLTEDDLGAGRLHPSVEHYGYTKLMQLQACRALRDELGVEFEHIVLANMYGPGDVFDYDRSHAVGGMIRKFFDARKQGVPVQLLGTGRAVRDLVYAKDVAELVHRMVKLEQSTNQPLNASTGVGTSMRELAETIADIMKFPYGIQWGSDVDDGALVKYLSTENLEKAILWKPQTKLRDGLKETIEWYDKIYV